MPFVSIVQSKRDPTATRRLITAITDSFVEICGVRPEKVAIHIQEVDGEHWAEAGVLVADRS